MKRRLSPYLLLGGSIALLLLAVGIAPWISGSGLSSALLVDLHLPRVLLGALSGFGLALSGVTLQSVLRNPLASPYTLGIASGSAVGAALAIKFSGQTALVSQLGLSLIFVGAVLGALLTAALVYAVASLRQLAAETLLLTGVAVALFASAAIALIYYTTLGTIDFHAMVRWSLGSLGVVGYRELISATVFVVAGCLLLIPSLRVLDISSLDDASALGMGVNPVRVRQLAFLGTSLATAGVVAAAGPIGFIGLVVPHAVRPFTGPDPRLLLPCAACVGGAFLVGCDVLARTLFYPTDLPINVITYSFGCPAFIWILVRRTGR